MRKQKMTECVLTVLIISFVLIGCGSARFATTLKIDPGSKDFTLHEKMKFSIVRFNAKQDEKSSYGSVDVNIDEIKIDDLKKNAKYNYPGLFGDNFTDLPVYITIDARCSINPVGPMLTGFTIGTIPFTAGYDIESKVHTEVYDENGYAVDNENTFVFTNEMWMTLLSPFGLLPIPGSAEIRRTYLLFNLSDGGDSAVKEDRERGKNLIMDSITEAVVQSIRQADQKRLKAALDYRKSRLQQVNINGQTFWSFLSLGYSDPKGGGKAFDIARLSIYKEYPTWDAKPVESMVVAQLKNDKWESVKAYLHSSKVLISAGVIIENNRPSKVIIREVAVPPFEDFIDLPVSYHTANDLRWSNGILIDAKNSSLPLLIHNESPGNLAKLVTRIEKAVLELNEKKQVIDGQIQQVVINNGNPANLTELSALYSQRMAIFQAILPSLKQSISKRR